MQMRLNHFLAERFQRPARGDDLHQHIGTIGIGFHHFFNGLNLAFDPPQTDDERSFLQPGTNVLNFHGKTFNIFYRTRHSKKDA